MHTCKLVVSEFEDVNGGLRTWIHIIKWLVTAGYACATSFLALLLIKGFQLEMQTGTFVTAFCNKFLLTDEVRSAEAPYSSWLIRDVAWLQRVNNTSKVYASFVSRN